MFNAPSFEKLLRDEAVNSGPPLVDISSGTRKVAKYVRNKRTKAAAPAKFDPNDVPNTFAQPQNLFPITKTWRPP